MTEIYFTESECIDGYKNLLDCSNSIDYDLLYSGKHYNIYKALTLKGCCILGYGMETCLTSLHFSAPVNEAWDEYSDKEEFIFIINKNHLNFYDNYYICLGKDYYEMYDKSNFPTNINSIINEDILSFINSDSKLKDIFTKYLEPLCLKSTYYEDIKFDYYNVKTLPRRMTFYGKVSFDTTLIEQLPEELYCEDDLSLRHTLVKELPKTLYLGRNLDIKHTPFRTLPNKMTILNNLTMSQTKVTNLPEDLDVHDNLNIRQCAIFSLPKSLKVGGTIYGFPSDRTPYPQFHFML